MKHLTKLLLLVAAFTAFSGAISAQNNKQRLTREQLAEAQAKHIAEKIEMDKATGKRFMEAYCQFQREIWALGPRPKRPHPSMTEEEIRQTLKSRFARSQKILNIRQKYYAIYSEFLTQKQILRVYDIEKQMMDRLAKRGKETISKGNAQRTNHINE